MRFKKTIYLSAIFMLSAFLIVSAQTANAAGNYSYSTPASYNANSLQGNVTYVPAGTVTKVMLTNSLNSATTTVGTAVNATLTNNFVYNNKTIASKGSVVHGTVIKAKKAGIGNRNGQIQVLFNSMTTPEGYSIPVNAVFKTDDNTGILKGGTKIDGAKDYAKNTVIGAGAGAALGTAMGALSSGSVGKGAIYGTAIGGGLGVAKAISNKGENVEIPASACLDVYFTQPITLSAPSEYKYEY